MNNMNSYNIEGITSFTLAIILLFLGKLIIGRSELLKRYSVPEPVIGGFLCAALVGFSYYSLNFKHLFIVSAYGGLAGLGGLVYVLKRNN